MSRMTENQRMQLDRPELSVPSTGVRVARQRPLIIYTVAGLILLGVGLYAAISGIDEWWQGLVFGVIIMTTIGLIIAVSPTRRA